MQFLGRVPGYALKLLVTMLVIAALGASGIVAATSDTSGTFVGTGLQAALPGRSDDDEPSGSVFPDDPGGRDPANHDSPVSPESPASSPVSPVTTPESPATAAENQVIREEVRLRGELFDDSGEDFGKADFRDRFRERDDESRTRFSVEVEDMEDLGFEEGDVLSVFVDGVFVGHVMLSAGVDGLGGDLNLDTDDGDEVLAMEAGGTVTLTDGGGNIVLTGTLVLKDMRLRAEDPATTAVSPATTAVSPATTAVSPATTVASPASVASPATTAVSPATAVSPDTVVSPATAESPVSPASPDNSGPGNARDREVEGDNSGPGNAEDRPGGDDGKHGGHGRG